VLQRANTLLGFHLNVLPFTVVETKCSRYPDLEFTCPRKQAKLHAFQTLTNANMEGVPVIIVETSAQGDLDEAFELRRRGFVVQSEERSGEKKVFAVTMSKRLIVKLSLQEEIPLKPLRKYSAYQSLCLANAAIVVVMRASSIGAIAAWIAQDGLQQAHLTTISGNEAELTTLCNYFGPHMSLQFGFISFNRYHLTALAVVGLIVFLQQASVGTLPTTWSYIYCTYLALWGSYHLQRWKQRQNSLLFLWGTLGADGEALDAEWSKVSFRCS
jgi:hypothetical protein